MRLKSALSALLLLTSIGATTVSCGDGSGSGDPNGSSGSAGLGGAGGSSASTSVAGSSSGAGASSSTAGSATAGSKTGGSSTGGMLSGAGGDEPNHSDDGDGSGSHDNCPATEPPPSTPCVRGASGFTGCHYGDRNCRCPPPSDGSAVRTWVCADDNPGGGGDTGIGEVRCPENAKTGDNCATPGVCAGQQCVCNQLLKVFCL